MVDIKFAVQVYRIIQFVLKLNSHDIRQLLPFKRSQRKNSVVKKLGQLLRVN